MGESSPFCVMRAYTDAFPAVNTALRCDGRLSVTDSYSLGRTPLDAVGAANALRFVQSDRVVKHTHLPHDLSLCIEFKICEF